MTLDTPMLTLLGTMGCHLCDEAVAVLQQAAVPEWQTVDIADDAALLARYGTRIPVVRNEGSGREVGWPFDAAALQELMASGAD
ncbi:glutaredoxin family protein [Methylotetracoccus oryzae]|uniref:glutaredoxin family protein n=1 Tax=Methylotetracoccus oryzae TaxID=1919059 RepID=UPI001F1ED155|nr:glutaredoxin family protein [Methylotetracoccus oryzae]